MKTLIRSAALALAVASLSGCKPAVVYGRVTTVRGEALPGVIVRTKDGAAEDLTDALGRYRFAAKPGPVELEYSKTGYGSIEHSVPADKRKGVNVSMWPLPIKPGLYVVQDFRFLDIAWVVPKQFFLSDGSAVIAAELPKDVREAAGEPFIVAYHTASRYNARISRLLSAETKGENGAAPTTVWTEAGTMEAAFVPLDDTKSPLFKMQVGRPLEPGIYAVHWGAMSGYTTLDNKAYLFRVPEPSAEEPLAPTSPPATNSKPAAEPAPKADPPKTDEKAAAPKAEAPADAAKPASKTPETAAPKSADPDAMEPLEELAPPPKKP